MLTVQPEPPGPGDPLPHRDFTLRRFGYDIGAVDQFFDLIESLPETEEGRRRVIELASDARFRLGEGRGYEPLEVDEAVDALKSGPPAT